MADCKEIYDQATIYELQKWLEKLYGDEPCPTVHPAVHNIRELLIIKDKNEEAEKNASEVIKTKKDLLQKYNAKTEELKMLIESEGVSLNEEIMKQVESLAGLAVKLNLKEPNLTNFLVAISDMKLSLAKKEQQKLRNSYSMSKLSKKMLKIQKQNSILKRDLEAMENITNIQNSTKFKISDSLAFMKTKSAEYENFCQKIEKSLESIGFEPSLSHRSLNEKSESVQALEKHFQELSNKLNSYKALPPNECLVNLEVQKKKEELLLLEKEFESLLEDFEKNAISE